MGEGEGEADELFPNKRSKVLELFFASTFLRITIGLKLRCIRNCRSWGNLVVVVVVVDAGSGDVKNRSDFPADRRFMGLA